MKENLCGTLEARQSLLYGTPEIYTGVRWWNPWYFSKVEPGGLLGVRPKHGMSGVYCPGLYNYSFINKKKFNRCTFVTYKSTFRVAVVYRYCNIALKSLVGAY